MVGGPRRHDIGSAVPTSAGGGQCNRKHLSYFLDSLSLVEIASPAICIAGEASVDSWCSGTTLQIGAVPLLTDTRA